MSPIDEPALFDLSNLASDLAFFEKLWHELDDREEEGDPDDFSKVRLRCSGELAHIGSIVLVGVRDSPLGDLIEFTCPRCDQRHESRLF